MIQLNDIKALLQRAGDRTLTLYLSVDPSAGENQAATPAWRIWLNNALRTIENGLGRNRDWPDIRARAEQYFVRYQPNSKGLALFTGPGFQQAYELPLRLDNQAAFGRPPVGPLLWLMDEHERYLIVLVNHEHALFYAAYLGEVGFRGELELALDTRDWRRKTGSQPLSATTRLGRGSSGDDFEHRVAEELRGFHRQVAQRTADFLEERGSPRIVLGGNEEAARAPWEAVARSPGVFALAEAGLRTAGSGAGQGAARVPRNPPPTGPSIQHGH